ncbi:hypothetical protein P167DRAFT_23668 [Morchella conica CCBAS932]|uniref:Uncharacterized protein n=1 Tax=Morchella conica CCBAS932 TaxID=1392247 RepID=A0A3N4KXL5_9PEZI|nr:hypothetical protein P167DRAFT_23668 [Morchella conica CCBAS932]
MYYIYPPVRQIVLAVASSALVALRVVDCGEVRTTPYSTFSSLSKSAIKQGRRKNVSLAMLHRVSRYTCSTRNACAGRHARKGTMELNSPVPS